MSTTLTFTEWSTLRILCTNNSIKNIYPKGSFKTRKNTPYIFGQVFFLLHSTVYYIHVLCTLFELNNLLYTYKCIYFYIINYKPRFILQKINQVFSKIKKVTWQVHKETLIIYNNAKTKL